MAPVCDPGIVSPAGLSVYPQGLRQLNVIAEEAEIVPSLPDPIAGWCCICFVCLQSTGWSQLRRTLSYFRFVWSGILG